MGEANCFYGLEAGSKWSLKMHVNVKKSQKLVILRGHQAHCVPNKQKLNNIHNVLVTEVLFPDSLVSTQFSGHTHTHTPVPCALLCGWDDSLSLT